MEAAIREGLDAFHVRCAAGDQERLSFYVAELMRWNVKVNLTGLKGAGPIVRELINDAFFLNGRIDEGKSVLDLGSGAGILAVPLSILRPKAMVYSIDKSLKKIQFQRHVKRMLHLAGFSPLHGRSEELTPLGVDCLVVKAFGSITDILEKGGGHIRHGGRALILKGKRDEAANPQGFQLAEIIPYALPGIDKSYRLLVYEKVS